MDTNVLAVYSCFFSPREWQHRSVSRSVKPPIWISQKFCTDVLVPQWVKYHWLSWSPHFSSCTNMTLTCAVESETSWTTCHKIGHKGFKSFEKMVWWSSDATSRTDSTNTNLTKISQHGCAGRKLCRHIHGLWCSLRRSDGFSDPIRFSLNCDQDFWPSTFKMSAISISLKWGLGLMLVSRC